MKPAAGPWLCRALVAGDARFLQDFLISLPENEKAFFHPHPFDSHTITVLCSQPRQDYYCGLFDGPNLVGYGMLRGWNEGFSTPSLGIAVGKTHRRQGCAQRIVYHLHEVARIRGAKLIRLTVYRHNPGAQKLFQEFGYTLAPWKEDRLIGSLSLAG